MAKQRIPYFLNSGSTGVTLSAGTAGALTKIVALQVQPGAKLILDRDTTLMLKDRGATETAAQSKATVYLYSPDRRSPYMLAETSYNQLKYNQDTRIQFHPVRGSVEYALQPFAFLEVWVNSDQAIATASTDFYLEAKQEPL